MPLCWVAARCCLRCDREDRWARRRNEISLGIFKLRCLLFSLAVSRERTVCATISWRREMENFCAQDKKNGGKITCFMGCEVRRRWESRDMHRARQAYTSSSQLRENLSDTHQSCVSLDCLFRAPYLLRVLSFRSHLHTEIGNKRNLPIGRRVSGNSSSSVVCSCCCLQDSARPIAVLHCCWLALFSLLTSSSRSFSVLLWSPFSSRLYFALRDSRWPI